MSPLPATPEDARALARATLAELDRRLEEPWTTTASLNAYTRAHLADSSERITRPSTHR